MSLMDRRYQVFVSSTYTDLIKERQHVMQALLELDCIPAGMELFPAADDDQWTLIKSVIDESDYYLVIVAGRYGSRSSNGISYTQQEYEYALAQKKPTIAFLHRDTGKLPSELTEQTDEGKHLLETFKGQVQKRMCKYWTTPDELGSVVSRSLVQLTKRKPGVGWIRGNAKTADYYLALEQKDELFKERENLKSEIKELRKLTKDIPKQIFRDFDAAWQKKLEERLFDMLAEARKEKEKVKIRALGMCLHKSFPKLKNFLLESDLKGARVEVRLAILDKKSAVWSRLDGKWNGLRSAFDAEFQDLIRILEMMKAENRLTGRISIKIHQYDYMPNFHGVMLNKKEIFLSSCTWDSDGHLKAGQNIYEHYHHDISDMHRAKVALFRRWFDYGRYNSKSQEDDGLNFDSDFPVQDVSEASISYFTDR